ncbi:MAG: FAD-dependent tricarballylate dehydrogenase TcuA [Betaproteobacteria bacterium]|jgi:tricarballylate dehydrogenase|nr:FAD-dependent tricarballylate dehydrogenase TcuA [Betaproteobacteria bacterium]
MQAKDISEADVVVVGAGNAALCAAMAAHEAGAKVIVLERAPQSEAGGNSFFTAGATRFVFNNIAELREVLDVSEEEERTVDFGVYTADNFFDDMGRVTQYRCDPDLTEVLVSNSRPTLAWMKKKGVKFEPMYGRQAHKVNGRFKFFGGQVCAFWGGGAGLVESEHRIAKTLGIPIVYETAAVSLVQEAGRVVGVVVESGGLQSTIRAKAVVLAAGGFESNAEMRARYLGPNWDLAKVRGTRFNMGDGINMAMRAGAMPCGHWSGAHAVGWDMNAPTFGDREVGDGFQKHSYPFSIMVNADGERFVDEGADFRNFTYAKYGLDVLKQPGLFSWQVYDAKVTPLLRDEYRIRQVTKVEADTLEALAEKMEGVNPKGFLRTVKAFNAAVRQDIPFNSVVKDGRCTEGLAVPKSNWANTLDTPPYQAYAVTCGITFTFGGVKVSPQAAVQSVAGQPIPGLFAAGEMVGGLFYFNYPSGTGLVSGAVFGRIAGTQAARHAGGL